MAICTFYQRGTCRFGDQCKFEHPGSQRDGGHSSGGTFGSGSNNNRSGGFNGDRYRPTTTVGQPSGPFASSRDPKTLPYHLDKADMKHDLTGQRPIYPLSCYGPGRDAPRQLIEGPVEISPEELRVRYYAQRLEGNEPRAQQEESALNEKMQQQVQSILSDIDGAIRYIEEGADVHPNRIDIANGSAPNTTAATATSNSNPFSQAAPSSTTQPAANPFMKAPSATFGQSSTPGFGQPAFGQAASPAQAPSAFGQPSNSGQSAPGFGGASALGQKPSPFGQTSALGTNGAFGKPAFGATGFGQASMPGAGSAQTSAFGQASTPGTAAPFGQASAVGQQANPFGKPAFGQTGFGQTSQPGANASPFGQAASISASPFGQAAPSTTSPFGQAAPSSTSPFGQAATSNASPFVQATQSSASPFGQAASSTASPFGQAAQPNTSPFGQASQPSTSPFGQQTAPQASPFGVPAFGSTQSKPTEGQANPFASGTTQPTSTFGQSSQPSSGTSPFGTQQGQAATQASNPFLQKPQETVPVPSAVAASSFGTQPTQSASSFAPAQQQRPAATSISQVAASGPAKDIDPKDRFKEGKPAEYEGEQGRILEEIYRRVGQLGRFNDNEDIPLVPPKCEWIVQIPLL